MKKLSVFFRKHSDDLLILSGVVLWVYATYQLSIIAAMYLGGALLVATGIIVGLGQKGKAK